MNSNLSKLTMYSLKDIGLQKNRETVKASFLPNAADLKVVARSQQDTKWVHRINGRRWTYRRPNHLS
jgi:hypothetical protein